VRRAGIPVAATVLLAAGACSLSAAPASTAGGGQLAVVAAESPWGSIAEQLGGERVAVTVIVDNPTADPHDYEPTAADARAIARARYVVLNGLGYDAWAGDLVDADDGDARTVLDVGDLLGLPLGANPHRWYYPADVRRVIDRITADYQHLDPAGAPYYAARHDWFVDVALADHNRLLASIRDRFQGTPVAASESIAAGLTAAAGLDLRTPSGFLDAISEEREPPARDKQTVDEQLARREVAVLIVNAQNTTPDVQRLVERARSRAIPVVEITETPPPATTFQDWQRAQLEQLAAALTDGASR